MVATREKHRDIVRAHLDAGEQLQALVNVNAGGYGGGTGVQASATTARNVSRYEQEEAVVEKGLNGHYSLHELWLALTDRRLLVFTGSWFTFVHKPKKLLTWVERDSFTVAWRPERVLRRDARLYHFRFENDQHLVRLGEADDEGDRFLAALGDQATRLPDDS